MSTDAAAYAALLKTRFQARAEAAADPQTPPSILGLLAQDPVLEVRVAAAKNVKTPHYILDMLRVAGASFDLRHRVASPPDTPLEILSTLAQSQGPWGRALAAAHPLTPYDHIKKLVLDAEACAQLEALNNPSLCAEDAAALVSSVYPEVRSALALWPRASEEILTALAKDPVESVRLQLTQRLSLPPEVWEALAQKPSERTLRRLAAHPNAPPKLLASLSVVAPQVLPILAQNPSTPSEILENLAQHPSEGVRRALVQNPKTSIETIIFLHSSDPVQVDAAILDNPTLTENLINMIAARERRVPLLFKLIQHRALGEKTLSILANHPSPRLREAIAAHPKATQTLLAMLCTDPAPCVRVAAAQNPNTSPEHLSLLIRAGAHPTLSHLDAADPTLAPEALDTLAQQPGWSRVLAASHPKTPSKTLQALAQSKDHEPHVALAQNPAAPAESLALLARSPRGSVRAWVAQNPSTPLPVLLDLCKDPSVPVRLALASVLKPPLELLAALVQDPNEAVLACVALHPATTPDLLRALGEASYANPRARRRVLARVTSHPACPEALLEGLLAQGIHPKAR